MFLQCYQSDDSRHSHQWTDESQILFQAWCHLYTKKTRDDQEQCPAAHQTKHVPIFGYCEFAPLTTTLCCLLHRIESIHINVCPLMPYPWSLHFRSSWRGVSNAFSKSNMNVSTWPPASKTFAQSFITVINCFTPMVLPESMLSVW